MKPNIFEIATKELTQDAFIVWLASWADQEHCEEELYQCAKDFIYELLNKKLVNFSEPIFSCVAGRQWKNIDVWIKINKKFLIVIEDKTTSKVHGKQLPKYKDFAENWCHNNSYEPPVLIYLKTGDESQADLNSVKDFGYFVFDRKDYISVIRKHNNIKNNIFQDFLKKLEKIEKNINSWETKIIKSWNGNDWQGFFQFLETKFGKINWGHVNNVSGGFWGAVLNWDYWGVFPVYLQIEEHKLCFKVSTDIPEMKTAGMKNGDVRNKVSQVINKNANLKNMHIIKKPKRFGSGKYMTVAVVECNNWLGDCEKIIDKIAVIKNIRDIRDFLRETVK